MINGRGDARFAVQFNPVPGTYQVTATIFFSPSSTTIGDPSFKPDSASAKTFSFTVLGARFSGHGINFQDDLDGTTGQAFTVQVTNLSNQDLLARVDVTIVNPDGTTSQISSDSILLHPGQTRNDISFSTAVLTSAGDYCFDATLKFGVDANNNGILSDTGTLGKSRTAHDCFSVEPQNHDCTSCDDVDDD